MFPSNPHWHVRQQDSLSYTSIFLLILSILSFNQQQYVIHVVRAQSSPYSFPVRYVIATVAGTGNSTFNGEGLNSLLCNMKPRDIVRPCEACSIYVADNENHRILKIQHGVVTTVAGSGLSSPFNGHDILATSANLNSPQGIYVSSNEEFLWIAETEGHRIRRVHLKSGNMTTVAGTGTPGNGGDGGLAVNAQLNFPTKVMVDSNSNLYIADRNNHKIRKVDTNGYISSFAGTGSPGNSGDGGPAQNAQLDFPSSLFQDEFAGDIFVVDTNNHAIRKVSKSGQMSTIVSGAAGLNHPSSVHYFPYEQQLSITDQGNHVLRKYSTRFNSLSLLAGNGTEGFFGDAERDMHLWGGWESRVVEYPYSASSLVGKGLSTTAMISSPTSVIRINHGAIFFADYGNNRIRKLTPFCEKGYRFEYSSHECFPECYGVSPNSKDSICGGPSRGQCIAPNTCQCKSGYSGSKCEYATCYGISGDQLSRVCNGRGKCLFTNTCICNKNYTGNMCQHTSCFGIESFKNDMVCSGGRGECVDYNKCSCRKGYYGEKCEFQDCFGMISNQTQVHEVMCSSHGTCVDVDQCNCTQDYYGTHCNVTTCYGVASNDTSVCSSNGKCLSYNVCECQDDFTGSNCEIPKCFGIPQHNSSFVCSGHGICQMNHSCLCEKDWTGEDCSIPQCFGYSAKDDRVCSGHGTCVRNNTCECGNYDQYEGFQCEWFKCFGRSQNDSSHVCSGHGHCRDLDTCQCESNYSGLECEIPSCYGIFANETQTVCNGHGFCKNVDECQCLENYMGQQCEITNCFGIPSNETNIVCNGHGVCSHTNSCQCLDHYFGEYCQETFCFGIASNDTTVCNYRNGTCVSFDHCQCHEGWFGEECLDTKCFGVFSNSSEVCSGHGQCITTDQCLCEKGYYGKDCAIFKCFGVDFSNSSVCSGTGKCLSNDLCQCENDTMSQDCSLLYIKAYYFNITFSHLEILMNMTQEVTLVVEITHPLLLKYYTEKPLQISIEFDLDGERFNVTNKMLAVDVTHNSSWHFRLPNIQQEGNLTASVLLKDVLSSLQISETAHSANTLRIMTSSLDHHPPELSKRPAPPSLSSSSIHQEKNKDSDVIALAVGISVPVGVVIIVAGVVASSAALVVILKKKAAAKVAANIALAQDVLLEEV